MGVEVGSCTVVKGFLGRFQKNKWLAIGSEWDGGVKYYSKSPIWAIVKDNEQKVGAQKVGVVVDWTGVRHNGNVNVDRLSRCFCNFSYEKERPEMWIQWGNFL